MKQYNQIIVSRLMGIGDAIMLTPLLQGIKRVLPETKLVIVTEKHTLPITSRMPFVDEAYGFTKTLKDELFFVKHFWRNDLVYCVDNSYRISLIYALAMIKERIGFPHKRGIYLTKKLQYEPWMDKSYEPYVHAMLFKQATGIDVTSVSGWGKFFYPEATLEEKEHIDNIFNKMRGGKSIGNYVAVSLESDTWQKDWPIQNWLQLFERFSDIQFVVLGVKSKRLGAIKFPANVVDMRGETTLIEMGYLVQKADLLIAVCSLFVHVAYALNTPVIGIYGPSPVWRCAPPNIFEAISSEAPCAPCEFLITGGDRCNNPFCMDSITVDRVSQAVRRFYKI